MASLIVLLPAGWGGDAAADADQVALPFALLDGKGELLDSGRAPFSTLPSKSDATVLIVAARDVQLLLAQLPPVTGVRLQRILPNMVEERLLEDPQRCHIAIGPETGTPGERCLAVVRRGWLAAVLERFAQAGHKRLRVVPLLYCIPWEEATRENEAAEATQADVGDVLEPVMYTAEVVVDAVDARVSGTEATLVAAGKTASGSIANLPVAAAAVHAQASAAVALVTEAVVAGDDASGRLELAVRQDYLGFGLNIVSEQLEATLVGLSGRYALTLWALDGVDASAVTAATARLGQAQPLSLAALASRALACRFNLCQFEFANAGRSRIGAGGFRPWRPAAALLAMSLAVSIVAINVHWFQLRQRRDAIQTQMTALMKSVFPQSTVVLDPHAQMITGVARLQAATGEVRADDFLALASGLARAMPPIPSAAIAALDYSNTSLQVAFKAGTNIDSAELQRRLMRIGISAQENEGKWTLKSANSALH
ncbi:type II secretion system protein GspL [Paraburkholderia jirisanensis]